MSTDLRLEQSTGEAPDASVESTKRVAVLIPSSNTSVEAELGRALPVSVSLHSSRLNHFSGVDPDAVEVMVQDIERASLLVATAGVDLIFVCATVPSLYYGEGFDRQIAQRIESITGIPATTTSSAMLAALRELKVKRLVLGSPFVPAMNEKIVTFLRANGFEVLANRGLGIEENIRIGRLPPEVAGKMAQDMDIPEADAVLLACTNWQTLKAIDAAERSIGKPVVTTTQASLWGMLRALGLPPFMPKMGALLADTTSR